jgi:hypothetical protein
MSGCFLRDSSGRSFLRHEGELCLNRSVLDLLAATRAQENPELAEDFSGGRYAYALANDLAC